MFLSIFKIDFDWDKVLFRELMCFVYVVTLKGLLETMTITSEVLKKLESVLGHNVSDGIVFYVEKLIKAME